MMNQSLFNGIHFMSEGCDYDNDGSSSSSFSGSSSDTDSWSSDDTDNPNLCLLPEWRSPADGKSLRNLASPPKESFASLQRPLTPADYYYLFLTDDILDSIAEETNRSAGGANLRPLWTKTDKDELKKFFGLVLAMGLVRYPKVSNYWSKNVLYQNGFFPNVMSCSRFQLLLRHISFESDQNVLWLSRTYKVRKIIDKLRNNFKNIKNPGQNIAVDQYTSSKVNRSSVKVVKITDPSGYTFDVDIYDRRTKPNVEHVCMKLAKDYLDEGRTLTVDSRLGSIELANQCLSRQTHLQGLLRGRFRGGPRLGLAKMKKKGCKTLEKDGIIIGLFKDKRKEYFISTKDLGLVGSTGKRNRRGEEILQPDVIMNYNRCRQGVDLTDRLSNCFSPIRKSMKWFHKVIFDVLLNIAIINAYTLYQLKVDKNIRITDFRRQIAMDLTSMNHSLIPEGSTFSATFAQTLAHCRDTDSTFAQSLARCRDSNRHTLIQADEKTNTNRKKRSRCVVCYANLARVQGSLMARKKAKLVSTRCSLCPNNQYYCLQHFQDFHK